MNMIPSSKYTYFLSLVLFGVVVLLGISQYGGLPSHIPIQYGFDGNPSNYASKEFAVWFVPGIYLLLILFLEVLVRISPPPFKMEATRNVLGFTLFATGILMVTVQAALVFDPGGQKFFRFLFPMGMGAFFFLIGLVIGKTERNYFIGFRVPWSLATEENWRATNSLGGKLMVISGVAMMVLSFFRPSIGLTVAVFVVPALIPVFYSYYYYVKYERQK